MQSAILDAINNEITELPRVECNSIEDWILAYWFVVTYEARWQDIHRFKANMALNVIRHQMFISADGDGSMIGAALIYGPFSGFAISENGKTTLAESVEKYGLLMDIKIRDMLHDLGLFAEEIHGKMIIGKLSCPTKSARA